MSGPLSDVLHRIRRLMTRGHEDESDSALVHRYVHEGDQSAFETLLRRHGPMVLGLARSILLDPHAAEDVFQAVFLVLARKAGAIRRGDSVGSWLFGVTARMARKARERTGRIRQHERHTMLPDQAESPASDLDQDSVRDEIERLPAKYRGPIVLCCVEGMSHEDAARTLGLPLGTINSRLARGRDLLRRRLTQRGILVPAGALAGLLLQNNTATALPERLAQGTLQLIHNPMTPASPAVEALFQGAIHDMFLAKIKTAAVLLLSLGVLSGVLGWAGHHAMNAAEPGKPIQPAAEARTDAFGDPLPPGILARIGTVRFRHKEMVPHVQYTKDGKLLSVSADGTIAFWDASGKLAHRIVADRLACFAASADAKVLVAANKNISMLDPQTGKEIRKIPTGKQLPYSLAQCAAVSDDGKRIATVSISNDVSIWNPADLKDVKKLEGKGNRFTSVAISTDGKRVAALDHRELLVWDVDSGKIQCRFNGFKAYNGRLTFSPDGNLLALSYQEEKQGHYVGQLRVWDTAGAKELWTAKGKKGESIKIAFSPDGKTVATGHKGSGIIVRNRATGEEQTTLKTPLDIGSVTGSGYLSLSYSPDGNELAAGWSGPSVLVWDLKKGCERLESSRLLNVPTILAFDSTAGTLTTGDSSGVRVWDSNTGKFQRDIPVPKIKGNYFLSPDGRRVAGIPLDAESKISVWDAKTGDEIKQFGGSLRNAWFSPDGKELLTVRTIHAYSGQYLSEATLWNAESGEKVRTIKGLGSLPYAVSPDFSQLAASTENNASFGLWDLKTGKQIHVLHDQNHTRINAVTFTRDGKTLITNETKRALDPDPKFGDGWVDVPNSTVLAFWNTAKGEIERKIESVPSMGEIAVSPTGKLVAGISGAEICLYETASSKKRTSIKRDDVEFRSLAFGAHDNILATACTDTTVLIWDLAAAGK